MNGSQKGLVMKLLLLLLLLIGIQPNTYAWFESCDEQWQSAWDVCDDFRGEECTFMDVITLEGRDLGFEYDEPDCEPEDGALKMYSGGVEGMDRSALRTQKLMAKTLIVTTMRIDSWERMSGLCNYEKGFGAKNGLCYSFEVDIENRSSVDRQGFELQCRVYFDDNEVLDHTFIRVQTSKDFEDNVKFLPQGSKRTFKIRETIYANQSYYAFPNKITSISRDKPYSKASYNCDVHRALHFTDVLNNNVVF